MWVFFQTLDPRIPKWKLDESLIGTNPGLLVLTDIFLRFLLILLVILGLGFRPLPPEDNVESTLIWYKGTNPENFNMWTNSLDDFLKG
jgi:sodium/potassium-transporting ATPase subunit beta